MKKIKIAQLGAGHDHASCAVRELKRLDKAGLFELVGFCTVPEDSENLKCFTYEGNKQAYEGVKLLTLEELLNYEGLEAVVIETEDRALTKYALMAAEKGLNIQMDKPGSADDREFDRLIDTVKANELVFHTGYMYRYNPAVIQLKRDIAAGKLGDIISVEAQMNCNHSLEKRNWMKNYPGGMLYYLGCHMIDLIYSIMGEPEKIIPLSCSTSVDKTEAEDFGMVAFKYKSGISFAKSTAIEIGGFERRQLVVVGTKGTMELCPFEWDSEELDGMVSTQVTGIREAYSADWHEKGKCSLSAVHGRYDSMLRAFADYINGERKNTFDYEYERRLHKIILRSCGEEL